MENNKQGRGQLIGKRSLQGMYWIHTEEWRRKHVQRKGKYQCKKRGYRRY